MLRIPNPGSDLNVFIRVFRDLHPYLSDKSNFGLDDISSAMIARNNVTSQGAIGAEALRRSTRGDRSLDGLYNQSKMYAELYRSMGWIHSTVSKLTFSFTALGHHIATASDPAALAKECLLGMAYPNDVLKVKGDQSLRVFGTILITIAELETLSRDEMIAGPLSIPDDSKPELIAAMVLDLEGMRRKKGALGQRLDNISAIRNIKRGSTMTNYTRYPMAALPWAGWARKIGPGLLAATDEGRAVAARVIAARDLRISDFNAAPDAVKRSLIIAANYRMLERGGFDLGPIAEAMLEEERALNVAGYSGELLFSPFQQLARSTFAQHAPEMLLTEGIDPTDQPKMAAVPATNVARAKTVPILVQPFDGVQRFNGSKVLEQKLLEKLSEVGGVVDVAGEWFIQRFKNANQNEFYPLVSDLFAVLGLDCRVSRAGVNNARADAMIVDSRHSIPIEIKSPGEETEISVKGVRQALENKIILRARKGYPTRPETTSLVVGFNAPNERSEVHELVDDIYHAFAVNVGILDFRTLLRLALIRIHSKKPLAMPGFHTLKGLLRVEVAASIR